MNQNEKKNEAYLLFSSNQTERSLEQLTQGLASLDISQTSTNHTPALSTPVGGARPKVRLSPEKVTCEGEVKVESDEVTLEQSQSAESKQPQVSRKSDGFYHVGINKQSAVRLHLYVPQSFAS